MAPPTTPNRRAQESPNSTQRPAKTSRHFDAGDKPSFAVPDDYFSSKPKSSKSTAYASPLSFADHSDSPRKSVPLTKENLEALLSSQKNRAFVSPPSLAESQSYMRRNKSPKKSQSPEKRKPRDENSHPLNLPPDELRRLSERMTEEQRRTSQADVEMTDADAQPPTNGSTSPPTTPGTDAPGAFPTSEDTNGTTTNGVRGNNEKSPTPPPHKNMQPKMDPEVFKDAGNKYFKAKDYDRAIEEYTKAVDLNPSNATYLSNRAAAYINANRFEQALGDIMQANRIDPGNEKILHRLARIYTSLGRPQAALDTYAKIKNASAADTQAARKAVSSIDIAEKTINDPDGNGNMALWNIDQAKQTLGTGAPMPRKWQLLRAHAYLKMATANALGEVQAITQSLMRENSMDPEALAVAGRAFYLKDDKGIGKSDYQRAEECFRLALSSDPDLSDARNWLKTMKKMERARNDANDVFKRGRYEEAVRMYSEALLIDPMNKITNAKLLGNRATANMKLKRYENARSDCDQALKFDPAYTKAKKTRAKAVGESGDWEQAVKDLKQLVEETQEPDLQKELRDAELELKKSKRKDYYKILGVDKDAGDKDIERAYKKRAAVLHPDKTMGDKKKEEEFKDCLEAKETLLDPQKRQMYDSGADLMEPGMGGMRGGFPGGFGGMGGGMGGGVQIDPEMLFNMMGGMGGGRAGGFGGGGGGGGGGMPHFSFSSGGGGGRGGGGFPF